MNELLPCPFCGGVDIRSYHTTDSNDERVQYAQCFDCTTCGPDHKDGKHWNTRVAQSSVWRDANKELPTHIHSVLMWVVKSPSHYTGDGGFPEVGIYNDFGKRWQMGDGDDDIVVEVSHWMPIADGPAGEKG